MNGLKHSTTATPSSDQEASLSRPATSAQAVTGQEQVKGFFDKIRGLALITMAIGLTIFGFSVGQYNSVTHVIVDAKVLYNYHYATYVNSDAFPGELFLFFCGDKYAIGQHIPVSVEMTHSTLWQKGEIHSWYVTPMIDEGFWMGYKPDEC